jgi:hypothetical protein
VAKGLIVIPSIPFESKYIRTKEILKYNGKFLEGISSDQKGGVGTPLYHANVQIS